MVRVYTAYIGSSSSYICGARGRPVVQVVDSMSFKIDQLVVGEDRTMKMRRRGSGWRAAASPWKLATESCLGKEPLLVGHGTVGRELEVGRPETREAAWEHGWQAVAS